MARTAPAARSRSNAVDNGVTHADAVGSLWPLQAQDARREGQGQQAGRGKAAGAAAAAGMAGALQHMPERLRQAGGILG